MNGETFQDNVQLAKLVREFPSVRPKARTLALVSANHGEGTTTCTVNLARYLAGTSAGKVLVVDANLRRPALHSIASVENNSGLTDLLRGGVELEHAIKATSLPSLFVLTSGESTADPNELLTAETLERRLIPFAQSFDFVLFDCAPVNQCPEATNVAASCQGVVLVVEAGRTRKQAAQKAKALLDAAKCNVLGVFMNKRKFYIPQFLYDRL